MQGRRMKNDHGCVSEAEGESAVCAVCPRSQRSTDSRDGVLQLSGMSISTSSGVCGEVSVNERCAGHEVGLIMGG